MLVALPARNIVSIDNQLDWCSCWGAGVTGTGVPVEMGAGVMGAAEMGAGVMGAVVLGAGVMGAGAMGAGVSGGGGGGGFAPGNAPRACFAFTKP